VGIYGMGVEVERENFARDTCRKGYFVVYMHEGEIAVVNMRFFDLSEAKLHAATIYNGKKPRVTEVI
jgi:hypothetical protein